MGTGTGPSKDTQGLPLLFTTDDSRGQIFLSSSFLPHQPLFFFGGGGKWNRTNFGRAHRRVPRRKELEAEENKGCCTRFLLNKTRF